MYLEKCVTQSFQSPQTFLDTEGQVQKNGPPSVTIRVKVNLFQTDFIFYYKYPDSHFLYAINCLGPFLLHLPRKKYTHVFIIKC